MKNSVLPIILTLLLLSVVGVQLMPLVSANFFPDAGPDLPRIYIKSDGSVQPETASIERTGNIYKLTGDIVRQTIIVECDGIVIDGAGYSIKGNSSWMGTDRAAGNNGVIIAGRNNVNITNFNIEDYSTGIRISSSLGINIVGNNFSDLIAAMGTPNGVVISTSSYVLIENNNFTDIKGTAIDCNGTNITIKRNRLTDVIGGVYGSISIVGSSNTIIDNKIETPYLSMRLGAADSNLIARNHITGAVSLVSCSNNRIFENNLTSIRIIFGSNNTIFNNNIADNTQSCTIDLDQSAINTTFYGNTFTANCTIRFNDAGATFWDNGTIGNYWSNYNGTDSNGDGIGDTPYIITAVKWSNDVGGDVSFVVGQDNYPLMQPYDVQCDAVVFPQSTPLLLVLLCVIIVVIVAVAGLLVYRRKHITPKSAS
jgi:nitrous oxidase accessory protein NosD